MISIVNDLPEDQWRAYVEDHPRGNIFQTPEMFQVFSKAKNHKPTLWAAVDENGHILALLAPVQVSLNDGLLRPLTTRAVAYGSVLYSPGPEGEKALVTLLRTYVNKSKGKMLFTELRNLSDLKAVQPVLNECGFSYEDHLNFLIDLDRPPEQVMQDIGSRTRKNIRRGLRKGEVILRHVTVREEISLCYELFQRSYANAQVPLADISLFEAAFDVLHPRDMVRFWLARVEDIYVATSVELLFKDVVYGWYGGVDRDYSNHMPGELLTWHILEWGAKRGYRVYDFGGAGKPDEDYGVRDFKAKFGGELVCFGRNTYVHSPRLLSLSELGYRIYRRLL
jgi:serine/alanine adding enzyme